MVVLSAVSQNGNALQFEPARSDYDIVLTSVTTHGVALRCAKKVPKDVEAAEINKCMLVDRLYHSFAFKTTLKKANRAEHSRG